MFSINNFKKIIISDHVLGAVFFLLYFQVLLHIDWVTGYDDDAIEWLM